MSVAGRAVRAVGLTSSAIVLSVGLAGCTQPTEQPGPSTTPSPSASSFFADEDEALAAATAAYTEYLKVSDAVAIDGWTDTTPLTTVATSDALTDLLRVAAQFKANGYRQVGSSSFDTLSLEKVNAQQEDVTIAAYLCLDVTNVIIQDQAGMSISPDGRVDRYPLRVGFVQSPDQGVLLLGSSESWLGENFC